MNSLTDNFNRFVPCDGHQHAVFAQHWGSESVLPVEREANVIALHAKKALVYSSFLITLNGNHATVLGADHDMTTCATKTAGRLLPAQR